jgi:hypothetical protein
LPRIIQAESSDSFQQLRILRNDVTSFAAFLESENSHGIQTRRSWQKGTWANLVAFANAHLLAGERVGVLERAGIDEHGLTIWKSNIFGRDLADDDPLVKAWREMGREIFKTTPDNELEAMVRAKQ